MKRYTIIFIFLLAGLLPLCGCGTAAPQSTANPDAAQLVGKWEQFIPIESMPAEITMDASGSAVVGGTAGRWRLEGDKLTIRQSGQEDQYSYTVTGYMLTLFDIAAGTSEFYINPDSFTAGADKNVELTGRWAAWSTFGKLVFDGGTGLDSIEYTTTGRSDNQKKYAARDGILQTIDSNGAYTYNLYSFASDGALQLAETTDYDNDTKQWTVYSKKVNPPDSLIADWTMAFDTEIGDEGLPVSLKLDSDGTGRAAAAGSTPADMTWEYYNGGFVILEYSQTNLQYAYCTTQGAMLSLGNPEVDEAWYTDSSRYKPTAEQITSLLGTWKLEDSKLSLTFKANATMTATNEAGDEQTVSVTAADGLLKLQKGKDVYYMAYTVDGDTMQLYYGQIPFLDQKEMPVTVTKS
jgi:hypothetical protein